MGFLKFFTRKKQPESNFEEKCVDRKKQSEKISMEAVNEWSEHMNSVTRLAIRNIIYKKDGYYCISMKEMELELKDCPTLVDVYLYIHRQSEDFKKAINKLYIENWECCAMEMVMNPNEWFEKVKLLRERLAQEVHVLSNRPLKRKDEFEICPKRCSLLALELVEKDMKILIRGM